MGKNTSFSSLQHLLLYLPHHTEGQCMLTETLVLGNIHILKVLTKLPILSFFKTGEKVIMERTLDQTSLKLLIFYNTWFLSHLIQGSKQFTQRCRSADAVKWSAGSRHRIGHCQGRSRKSGNKNLSHLKAIKGCKIYICSFGISNFMLKH